MPSNDNNGKGHPPCAPLSLFLSSSHAPLPSPPSAPTDTLPKRLSDLGHSRSRDRRFFSVYSERRSIERYSLFRLQPAPFRGFFPALREGLHGNFQENSVAFAGFGEL